MTVAFGVSASISGVTISGSVNNGGIVNSGTLTLEHSMVKENQYGIGSGNCHAPGRSGGLTVIDSQVTGNGGVGLWNSCDGVSTLKGSSVSNNSGTGIYIGVGAFYDGIVTIDHSTVTGNGGGPPFPSFGGVFVDLGGTLVVNKSTISDNHGSGMTMIDGRSITIDGGTITGNHGSGVAAWDDNIFLPHVVTIKNSTISNNLADSNGGGVAMGIGPTTIDNSTISGNRANGSGGGIAIDFGAGLTLTNSTVSGNFAAQDGGGIWNNFPSKATVKGSRITRNVAAQDGGGIFSSGVLSILTSTVRDNKPSNCVEPGFPPPC